MAYQLKWNKDCDKAVIHQPTIRLKSGSLGFDQRGFWSAEGGRVVIEPVYDIPLSGYAVGFRLVGYKVSLVALEQREESKGWTAVFYGKTVKDCKIMANGFRGGTLDSYQYGAMTREGKSLYRRSI